MFLNGIICKLKNIKPDKKAIEQIEIEICSGKFHVYSEFPLSVSLNNKF